MIEGMKECPYCGEEINAGELICPCCNERQEDVQSMNENTVTHSTASRVVIVKQNYMFPLPLGIVCWVAVYLLHGFTLVKMDTCVEYAMHTLSVVRRSTGKYGECISWFFEHVSESRRYGGGLEELFFGESPSPSAVLIGLVATIIVFAIGHGLRMKENKAHLPREISYFILFDFIMMIIFPGSIFIATVFYLVFFLELAIFAMYQRKEAPTFVLPVYFAILSLAIRVFICSIAYK